MADSSIAGPLLPHLAACVTFFFNRQRLRYLTTVVANYVGLASRADVYIITNADDSDSQQEIRDALPELPPEIMLHFVTPTGLGHPYLLTWTHRDVFCEVVRAKEATHFLYSEDDLEIKRENIAYWLRAREQLRPHGLIPSLFRVEQHSAGRWYSTDCKRPIPVYRQPSLEIHGDTYLCLPNPYQGTYLLDRDLMDEFSTSPAFSPDFGDWGIREKAAQGLTHANVPRGFSSRNVLRVDVKEQAIPQECWVHHLPNNYVNDPDSRFGKVLMEDVLVNSRLDYSRRKMLSMFA